MPPLPPPAGLHPLVVHFPIGLLMTVPAFLVLALALPRHRAALAVSALILMALGTVAAFVAVATGEEAEEAVEAVLEATPAADRMLHDHEEAAERTRLAFATLTAVFAGLVFAGRKAPAAPAVGVAHLVFLAAYVFGLTVLANTAHRGGLLVHGFGAKAPVAGMPPIQLAPGDDDAGDGGGGHRGRDARGGDGD